MTRAMTAIAATAVLALGSLAFAAPAAAADLPLGDTIFVIADGNIYTAEVDGTVTEVADMPDGFIMGADVDPTTGIVYFVIDGDPETACQLWTLNLDTLVPALVGDLDFTECDGLDVASDGTLRIGDDNGAIATVNKATAATLSAIEVILGLSWIAEGPGGQFYIGTYSGTLYTLNTTSGATVEVADPALFWDSGDFDSAGTLWTSARVAPEGCQGLASLSLSDPDETYLFEGDFLEEGTCTPVTALFIVPTPEPPTTPPTATLPATGLEANVNGMLLAGLALLAGAAALLIARARRNA